jgi:glycosyl transferase family 1
VHRDRSVDVVHYDLMTWLSVHPSVGLPTAPTVCSGHDAYSLAYRVKARFAGGPVARLCELARALAFERFERACLSRADVIHMVSPEDVRYLRDRGVGGNLRQVNMPLDDRWFVQRRNGRPVGRRVLTSGFHSQSVYRIGLLRFLRTVWPAQVARFPDAALTVHSAEPTAETEAATLATPGATLVGIVPDFASLFEDHGLFVHPLLGGTGQKNRLAIALAQGACCLATDAAASGMGLAAFEDYLPFSDLSGRDAALLGEALSSADLAATVAESGRRKMASEFSTRAVGTRLVDLYREAVDLGQARRLGGACRR